MCVSARDHAAIAIGNVLGSSIFTDSVGLGAAGLAGKIAVHHNAMVAGLLVLVALTLSALLFLRTARTLRRWEGALLLAGYLGFAVRLLGQ
jgi:cation:H+ antiporter